ncbi:acyltransferase [uncultured Rikenella sp.]|uniref:acyltransferase family protein n=1 Tax=uncultured Rikenella sp. TaxID=368003 RepID=UPI0025D27206|nr:acyltransferase [uncultured Rikenella sp.]
MTSNLPLQFPQKPHYEILDGLRGVAALIVVAFHLFEIYAVDPLYVVPFINHGYLAVDFFFVLSGFVIGYAYDDRWGRMTLWDFCKRRVIRLQPMVVVGAVIGGLCFYFGAGKMFPQIGEVPVWQMLLVMLAGCLLIPTTAAIRQPWHEMFPLNGPAWSLFFEYIGNLLYAAVVRRFSKRVLVAFVAASGVALLWMAVGSSDGSVLGGHELTGRQFGIGMVRLLYPFFGGLLLFRLGRRIRIPGGFWLCSSVLAAILFFPRLGGEQRLWLNGLYESISILFLFPLIVLAGAGSPIRGKVSVGICKFLGEISFPLYIIHYPFVYLFMAYVKEHDLGWQESWPLMIAVGVGCVVLAYGFLKLFDEPVRAWLRNRFLRHAAQR